MPVPFEVFPGKRAVVMFQAGCCDLFAMFWKKSSPDQIADPLGELLQLKLPEKEEIKEGD